MKNDKSYIFGPVPSRRLGLSLGIDLIPIKTCTYNCLYCQVGKTTHKTGATKPFVPTQDVLKELEERLEKIKPDTITLSGSGEPTLHSQIDQVISFIKGVTDIRIAILTNGSLFWKEEVRSRVSGADIIMPTLTTVFEKTFRTIHRPHPDLNLSLIIEGLKSLRKTYRGLLFLEVFFLAGLNDSEKEIDGLKRVVDQISPDRIQLNTVVRPPADSGAIPLDRKRLEEIKELFGDNAEIIADAPLKQKSGQYDSLDTTVLEMARRRPVRAVDLAHVLNMSLGEVEGIITGLLMKGSLRQQEHSGEVYYVKGS
jgi:wyosine [tRNA(Phe)-imidazoG37] synthetase (radical SAM superfamily)